MCDIFDCDDRRRIVDFTSEGPVTEPFANVKQEIKCYCEILGTLINIILRDAQVVNSTDVLETVSLTQPVLKIFAKLQAILENHRSKTFILFYLEGPAP